MEPSIVVRRLPLGGSAGGGPSTDAREARNLNPSTCFCCDYHLGIGEYKCWCPEKAR